MLVPLEREMSLVEFDVAITSLSEATVGKVAEEVRSMGRGRRS